MPMPDDYLDYPHRSYGMDQDLYAWRPAIGRAPLQWPGGQAVAAMIVVPIEHHMLNPAGKPFKHPGAMVTPYPDLRHYTTRDYGNRVGAFRILDALRAQGLKATFPVNAAAVSRLRPLVDAILADGHEIAAYGLDTDHIHWGGLERETEAEWVGQVRKLFDAAGLAPTTWMSPARQQSFATLELVAANGFTACLDWETDEVPLPMTTPTGEVLALPLSYELDDRLLLQDRRQAEDQWAAQVLEAAQYLADGADRFGGRALGFTLTPYVAGQPFRISAVRTLLEGLARMSGVAAMRADAIATAFREASAA